MAPASSPPWASSCSEHGRWHQPAATIKHPKQHLYFHALSSLFQLLCNTLCWLLTYNTAAVSSKILQAPGPHLSMEVKAAWITRCQYNQDVMMPHPCRREIQSHVSEPFWYIHVSKGAEPPDTGHCEFTWARGRLFDQDAAVVLYEMCAEQPLARVLEVRGDTCTCCTTFDSLLVCYQTVMMLLQVASPADAASMPAQEHSLQNQH